MDPVNDAVEQSRHELRADLTAVGGRADQMRRCIVIGSFVSGQ